MKKFIILISLMIISSSILFAQSNSDIDLNAKTNPNATTFTDDLFDHHFDFICGDASGEAGIETNGEYIYTSKWNGDGFFCYEMDGTFLGAFPVPGEAAVRDLAYDGTYFYGAAANTQLFEMDFDGQSGTLISTLSAAVDTRAIAYNPEYDAFYGNNWSDPITLYDRTGGILNQWSCNSYSSYYGFAYVTPSNDGPFLYGFAQSGGGSQAVIVQIDPVAGDETGLTFDAIGYSTTGTGLAGGLAAFDTYAPGLWTLLGTIQNETIFGIEGGIAGPPPDLDLALKEILEPNTGFILGVEDIVIRIKNQGTITQSNFEVRYRVDNSEWVSEIVPGPIVYIESIDYTFNEPYDFTEYKSFHIEAEVLLTGDEFPENNFANKWMEIMNPIEWCEYSITMWDSYGDGWNGNYVQIYGNGVEYVNVTLESGYGPETVYFLVCDSAFLTSVFSGSAWPEECTYEVYDHNNDLIFTDGPNPTGGDIGYATCEPLPSIDVGVTEIISPYSSKPLGIEPVTVKVKNFGSQALSEIPVGFNFEGTGWVNEIITETIDPGIEIEYTFTDSVDLSEVGTYFIEVCTFVSNDCNPVNDCIEKEVEHILCWYDWASTTLEAEYIANVTMGMIDNSSGWQGEIADYTDQFTFVEVGIPQEIVVTNGEPWADDYVYVWVDWDNDCVLNADPEENEQYPLTNDGTGSDFTGEIIAPENAVEGPPRMRIRMTYNSIPFPYLVSSYGEVEDYTIIVDDLNFPEIIIDTNSFLVNIPVGGSTQEYLEIGNIGDTSLFWNIEVSFGPVETSIPKKVNKKAKFNASITDTITPWLSVYPLEGIIEPQCTEDVNLCFNAMDHPNGTVLIADIILSSNDPFNPEILIPVKMTIGEPIVTQTFNLEASFQFISANIIPDTTDMMVILSEILNDNLDFVRNSQGQTIRKIGSTWVNGIGDWIIEEGYLIKMFNDDSFTIEGQFVDSLTPIFVNEGFQFVSYFPNTAMDALIAFETIISDNLDFIRNSQGQTLRKIGPNWVNGIGECQTNEAYLVKMFSDDILIFPISCGYPFTDPRDERIYNTVQIGVQCWMAENLNIGQMINGTEDMTDNGVIEKYCYDNDPYYCEVYGGLYQWNEMMEYATTHGVQGICPEGWSIPTDDEWKILEGNVDSQFGVGDPEWDNTGDRGYDAGLNLRSSNGWSLWGNGTNLFGFTALPGGHRNINNYFQFLGGSALFWTSTNVNSYLVLGRYLSGDKNTIARGVANELCGHSVRCIKNEIFNVSTTKFKMPSKQHYTLKNADASEPVWTIYFEKGSLNIGDEIAVFDGDVLSGSGFLVSDNIYENEIPVFSSLFKSGNSPLIKVWNKNENKEYILKDYTFSNPYGDAWIENFFPKEDGEYSLLNFSTTGLSDENMINDISIYPNPTTGIITIENLTSTGQACILEITDITGKIVIQSKIINNQSSIEIDLSWLEKGVYFININGCDYNTIKKIVIQ
ncbi:MAG: T9SS type A sorting domain-containing protein [Bacteroidales bacterium]|nr:T9SS type A sorting domain-containing protein [Bacteroidales bacterium]